MKLIQVQEAAERTGVTKQTIRNWIAKGILPAKKISGTNYLDADMLDELTKEIQDVEETRRKLEEEREFYHNESKVYRTMIDDIYNDKKTYRYLSICVNRGIRTEFFDTMIRLLEVIGILNQREGAVLLDILHGETYEVVGERFGLTRERIRQIAEKAIRRSRDLTTIQERLDLVTKYEEDITMLKSDNKRLRELVRKQDEEDKWKSEMSEEERIKYIKEHDEMCKLLSTRLVDCDLTVRSLNCLMAGDVETIGDLARIKPQDLLKFRNFGKKSLVELRDLLDAHDLSFGMDVDKIYEERVKLMLEQGI